MDYRDIDRSTRIDPHLDVRDFRFFIAVADELHFGRAAARLHVAQPHLSAHIKQLEARLSLKLFERTSRSVILTPGGQQFLERAKFILNQVEEAVTVAQRAASGMQGRIRISFVTAAGFRLLPSILRTFRAQHPHVDIVLKSIATDLQVNGLLEGKLDFAFMRTPVSAKRIETWVLARERMVVALPPEHPLCQREELAISDLAKETFVGFSPGATDQLNERIVATCRNAGFVPRFDSLAEDTYSVLALVSAGFGIAVLPEWISGTQQTAVLFKPLLALPPIADIALAWIKDDISPLHAAFAHIARQHIE